MALPMLALPLLLLAASPADDFATVEVKATAVSGNVSMLQGKGGNIGVLVGPDGVLIVDDEYAPLVPKILAALKQLSPKPVRFVVNTHFHGDHVGGNAGIAADGAVIVAQDNVRKRMSTEQVNKQFNIKTPPYPAVALPVITFTDSASLHLDGEDIEVFHVAAAHTDSDAMVWFHKANVVHAGDTFFNGIYPFIDAGSGGSLNGMVAAADLLLGRIDDQTKVIPGHGPLGSKADLKRYRDMLATVRDRIQKAIAEGKTMDQVVASKPTADFDAVWGGGFLKPTDFVGMAYMAMQH